MGFECEEGREGGREGRVAGRRNKVGPRAGSQHAAKHKYYHIQTVFLIKFCASTQPPLATRMINYRNVNILTQIFVVSFSMPL